MHCYLKRFGIPRAGFWLSQIVCARDVFTATQAGRLIRGSGRFPRCAINRSPAREMPVCRHQVVFAALLWPRPPYIRAGAAVTPLLARFCIRGLHARRAAFPCAQRYAARQQRRFSTRGGMRRGRTVSDYAFRIPHSAFSPAAITFSAFYFTPYLSRYASMRARISSSI